MDIHPIKHGMFIGIDPYPFMVMTGGMVYDWPGLAWNTMEIPQDVGNSNRETDEQLSESS